MNARLLRVECGGKRHAANKSVRTARSMHTHRSALAEPVALGWAACRGVFPGLGGEGPAAERWWAILSIGGIGSWAVVVRD